MKYVEQQCFFGDLRYKHLNGDTLESPMPIANKMESLLETAAQRRKLVLDRLRRSAGQPVVDTTHEIAEKDMQNMCNDWFWDVDSWMNEDNLPIYHDLRWRKPNKAQQMAKKAWSTYKFHLAGSKFLLHKLIQLPIVAQCSANSSASAEQPASLMKCISDLQEHMKTDEYKTAVERSQRRANDHRRLSKQIWEASQWLSKGKVLSMKAQNGQFWELYKWEQELVEEYDGGKLERSLQNLVNQRAPIYRGIGASVQCS